MTSNDDRMSELIEYAKSLGVSDAQPIGVDQIIVEDHFRDKCEEPRCPNYDSSINCPPHTMIPAEFREFIKGYTHVIAFKFDMPMEALQEGKRREAGLLLHETTAAIERYAKSLGFERARGYSSGGCKRTLCHEHAECQALQDGGECRNPEVARPSLSGMGVNWSELSKSLGWVMLKSQAGETNPQADTVMMSGLVFIE